MSSMSTGFLTWSSHKRLLDGSLNSIVGLLCVTYHRRKGFIDNHRSVDKWIEMQKVASFQSMRFKVEAVVIKPMFFILSAVSALLRLFSHTHSKYIPFPVYGAKEHNTKQEIVLNGIKLCHSFLLKAHVLRYHFPQLRIYTKLTNIQCRMYKQMAYQRKTKLKSIPTQEQSQCVCKLYIGS